MPEPITIAAIGSLVIAQAAQKIGQELGGLFVKNIIEGDRENRERIKDIQKDVKRILEIVIENNQYLKNIPLIVENIIQENEIDQRHHNLKAIIQTYLDTGRHKQDAYAEIYASWKYVLDYENKISGLMEIPIYTEYMIIYAHEVSGSEEKTRHTLSRDIGIKIKKVNKLLKNIKNDLAEYFNQLDLKVNAGYVENIRISEEPDWVSFSKKPDRYDLIQDLTPKGDPGDGFIMNPPSRVEVLDKEWNSARDRNVNEIEELKKRLLVQIEELNSIELVLRILNDTYKITS